MSPLQNIDPKRFIADFDQRFHDAVVGSDEDLADVVDRFYTPDVMLVADGHRMDREKLIAHARPSRRKAPSLRIEMEDAMVDGDRLAARYWLHVKRRRKSGTESLIIEVACFAQFDADLRMRRAHMLTRMERVPSGDHTEVAA